MKPHQHAHNGLLRPARGSLVGLPGSSARRHDELSQSDQRLTFHHAHQLVGVARVGVGGFAFSAERYEPRSVAISSNLVFSDWDKIFKGPLTPAAALDRVVHHSVIVESGREIKSYRAEAVARRAGIQFAASSSAQDTTD